MMRDVVGRERGVEKKRRRTDERRGGWTSRADWYAIGRWVDGQEGGVGGVRGLRERLNLRRLLSMAMILEGDGWSRRYSPARLAPRVTTRRFLELHLDLNSIRTLIMTNIMSIGRTRVKHAIKQLMPLP